MAQPSIDLPDPLEQPHIGLGDTDDLLAELAGQEIDRLMAQGPRRKPTAAAAVDAEAPPAPVEEADVALAFGEPTPDEAPDGATEPPEPGDFDANVWADIVVPWAPPAARPARAPWRPFAWLNAPFAAAPEWAGQMLVKIAIIILVNAVAILAYVFFTRTQR